MTIRTAILFFTIMVAGFFPATGQTVDDIIQKHIVAIGGADNWKKLTSIRKSCVRMSRGVEIPITITILQGKGFKYESTTNGMTSYSVYTNKEGWNYNPRMQKPQAVPEETVKQIQDLLDIQGPLIDYKAKGHKAVLYGTDDVEGTECYKIKVTLTNGKEQTFYIDAESFNLVRITEKTRANGKEQMQNTTYSNYEKLPGGIVYPMYYENGFSGVTIRKIELNTPVEESFFTPANPK
jgi:outer membrane lipoprotein-sorting protein